MTDAQKIEALTATKEALERALKKVLDATEPTMTALEVKPGQEICMDMRDWYAQATVAYRLSVIMGVLTADKLP
jgi:hypothetical protein